MLRLLPLSLLLLGLVACATNPVTGRNEFTIMSPAQEIQVGEQQYLPSRQSQGGEYQGDPELSAYVSRVGQRVAAVSDNDLPYEFTVLNNSVPNAWALPGGKIAINRGLLVELSNEAELAAVLGHEVVHAAARHGAQAMTRGTLLQGALVVGSIAASDSEYADYIVGGAQLGAQLISQRYGRDAEREADAFGIRYMVEAGYDPQAAVSLQEVFLRLSEGRNQDWLSGLFASHPPSQERVNNNQALVNEMQPQLAGRDLEIGEARYQQAIAHLREIEPAYELMAEAEQAVRDDNLPSALALVDEALAIAPGEAHLHGLKGDIRFYQERYQDAIQSYDRAIQLNDAYFEYFLGRGVAHARLGERQQARTDLEQSTELLPTARAANELGKIALASNDRNAAKQYFEMAAGGQGRAAQEAAQSFARLDIRDNPERYLQVEAVANDSGQILARVMNPTNLTLRNIQLTIDLVAGGSTTRSTRSVATLSGGSAVNINSGLTVPMDFVAGADEVRIDVTSVEVE